MYIRLSYIPSCGRPHVTVSAETIKGEKRWKLFGKTASNRYLVVVFTIRRTLFRTVTAYEMNAVERRKYARKSTNVPKFTSEAQEADWYATPRMAAGRRSASSCVRCGQEPSAGHPV
jgi:hypothetical protein